MDLLMLDYMIGTWVLLPIVVLVLLCTLLRQKLMNTTAKAGTQPDMQQQFVSYVFPFMYPSFPLKESVRAIVQYPSI